MSDWTSGYVADIGYTYGYYTELNPLRVKLAFLNAGLKPPEVFNACELGYGQGLSIVNHAAASMVQWCGTDFIPEQAAFAQELESVTQSGARLYDEAFDQFCSRDDLPEFDYIGLHGIWSWVSDENRAVIVDFIRRKLKVGGVLYISYNTQPGWAGMVPMRDLLLEHKDAIGSVESGIGINFKNSLKFALQLIEVNPRYAQINPHIKKDLEQLMLGDSSYLVHEYFNRNWIPMSFTKIYDILSEAKLSYACSANYLDHVDAINISTEQKSFIEKIKTTTLKETVRDFCVNQNFRKDYWVKGGRKINPIDQIETLKTQRVVLSVNVEEINYVVKGVLGDIKLQETLYRPILKILEDNMPRTIGEIEQELKNSKGGSLITFSQLIQVIMVISGTGALMPAQSDEIIEKLRQRTHRLNLRYMQNSRSNGDINFLSSPVTGGSVVVTRFEQLYLLARIQGFNTPKEWANYAWKTLSSQGQLLMRDGKVLKSEEENLQRLEEGAQFFNKRKLKVLKALQIA